MTGVQTCALPIWLTGGIFDFDKKGGGLAGMMSRWKKAKTYPNKMEDVVNRGRNGR